jgi:hypothetical protein
LTPVVAGTALEFPAIDATEMLERTETGTDRDLGYG